VLLALPALRADDKPKDQPPNEQYAALVKEYQTAQQAAMKAMREAKTTEERQKASLEARSLAGKFAPRFLELAEKSPKEAAAVDALVWVVNNNPPMAAGRGTTPSSKAIDILLKDHVSSEKLAPVCQMLGFGFDDANGGKLRTILEKNPHQEVQAEACMALAQNLRQRSTIVRRIQDDKEMASRYESFLGKETVEQMKKADAAKLESDSEAAFRMLGDKYLSQLKPERILNICQQLSFNAGKGGESLLRTIMDKDQRRDVQGVACLSLASAMKQRADEIVEKDAKEAARIRKDCEELFERCVEKFADVKAGFRGTVGERAKGELFEIRNLAVGLPAPKVEGEDQDGKKFTLSDYKGKVVLLDFWSEF